ncbi:hypothetical protein CH330_06865 [candidate division WOR-3 bacterium JGI_Cruoil_03_51_56]|uniref:DUF6242 domain-containing protein n=1 Tax=candidate division WOR-3 bacterium JGI_Cruoil_03_51_56 TaxID=1973747 RepID=A0A235BS61_UNCW3|nr:MAG: hypothetical protein CH330_06865 [candidate division WOR-3 bacterium JGI_Cruoil_03_51_56]
MRKLTVLFCFGFIAIGFGSDNWEQLGPNGITVSAMTTVPGYPDDIYLVSQGYPARIFYTSNTGATWQVRDTIQDQIDALALDPVHILTLYCAGKSGKVYQSTDGGRIWQTRGTVAENACVRQLAINPHNSLKILAIADIYENDWTGLGVFRSQDGGTNWVKTVLDSGFSAHTLLFGSSITQPDTLFVGGGVNNKPRLYKSGDGGNSWHDISSGLSGTCAYGLAVCPTDPNILVCATDAGIYRSTDSGANWTIRLDAPAYSVEFAQASPHYAYAGSDNLVYRSDDDGMNWSADTTDFFGTETRWLGLNMSRPLELYAGNGAGIFYTTDGGYNWTELTRDLHCLTVPFLYFYPPAPDTIFTCPLGYGIIKTTDSCQTWTKVKSFPGAGFTTGIGVNPRDSDTIIAVSSIDSRLHLTTDQGDSWVSYPVTEYFDAKGLLYHPFGPDTIYTWGGMRDSATGPTRFAIFKSTSQGQTWSALFTPGNKGICLGFRFIGTGETLYTYGAVDSAPALYRSTNHGGTWLRLNSGINGAPINDFARSPANPDVYFCATPSGVFRTLNHGTSWTDLGLSDVSCVLPGTADENSVFAGTDTQAIFYTTNAGVLWERDTIGFVSRTIIFLQHHPDNPAAIFCSTAGASLLGQGVIGITESPGHKTPRPITVFPSLITKQARILLPMSKTDRTTIDLYHPDGRLARRIAVLRPTPKTYNWTRPETLASGVYLLVIRPDTGQYVTKIILN